MFNQDIKRVGFACKYMVADQTQNKKVLEELAAEEAAKAKSYREALAANLKRIAEKAAKATENDTEQSIEDELVAFEAELAAELGQ